MKGQRSHQLFPGSGASPNANNRADALASAAPASSQKHQSSAPFPANARLINTNIGLFGVSFSF
jgi:hypothetical protein